MTQLQQYVFGVLCISCAILIGWVLGWKLEPSQSTTTITHPAIHSPIEVFVIPLNDTIGDVCYDVRVAKLKTDEYVVIDSRCPVDSNRYHRNVLLDRK